MTRRFEELDWQDTPNGEVTLRRRLDLTLDREVYEVKLGEEFLMSSLFTVAERALARLGLAEVVGERLDVVVGGLGLGYTAAAALQDQRVERLSVVEAVAAVISWHRNGLLPDVAGLAEDPRVRLVHDDFFALAAGPGFDGGDGPGIHDAILLDIDHTPRHLLSPTHAGFYSVAGLSAMKGLLRPGGVFGLWSDDPPDDKFGSVLSQVFTTTRAEVVSFPNPLTGGESANTVYLAHD